jgi:precorrin-6B methylase 2
MRLTEGFAAAQRLLPDSVEKAIGRSKLLKPLRDKLLRPEGRERIEQERIKWECFEFEMFAPPRVLVRARRGIENRVCRLILSECKPGSTALDVGANYGFVTLTAAQRAHVVSVECEPQICAALRRSVEANGLDCEVIEAFAGDTPDTLRIDSLNRSFGVIKIDVDGPDYEVLCGAVGTIEKHHPAIVIETETKAAEIYRFLSERYPVVRTMEGLSIVEPYPKTMVASTRPFKVPPRGSLRQ